MKVLVIAKLKREATQERLAPEVQEQARSIWNAYKANLIREMYYWPAEGKAGGAVLIFESESLETVREFAEDLPVARAGLVDFDIYVLEPYINLEVLFGA